MHRSILLPLSFAFLFAGCDDKPKPSTGPTSSSTQVKPPVASAAKPLPPLELETYAGLGITFQYPKPYKAEAATSNPEIHQVAVDHGKEAGVLTIRFDPKNPGKEMSLEEIGEATRQRMGAEATMAPTKLTVAGKEYEARTIKSNQLGLVAATDVVAVVPLEGSNYIVLTHVSDVDAARAQRMFDTVLGSLAAKKE